MERGRYLKEEKKLTLCVAPHDSYFPRKISDGIWKKDAGEMTEYRRRDEGGVMEIRGKNTMNTQGETNPRNQTFNKISTFVFVVYNFVL